jgi:hypothetical protein
VQLELLQRRLACENAEFTILTSQATPTALPLDLTDAEQLLLLMHQDKVASWGWRWVQQASGCSGLGAGRKFLLTAVPQLLGTVLGAIDLKVSHDLVN